MLPNLQIPTLIAQWLYILLNQFNELVIAELIQYRSFPIQASNY